MPTPVKLIAKSHKIRNDLGILYTTHTAIPCNDLDAPECAFERAQIAAGVLIVIPEVDEAAAIAAAEAAAKAEEERLAAEAEAAAAKQSKKA